MTKKELLGEIASNIWKTADGVTASRSYKLTAATEAMRHIDHKKPFVFAVIGMSKVVCLQPRGDVGMTELNAMVGVAKELTDATWYYYNPDKGGVVKTIKENVILSLEEYINRRKERMQ